jgi:hypothetical protein
VLSALCGKELKRKRVKTKRVCSPADRDIEGVLDLFARQFPEDGSHYDGHVLLNILTCPIWLNRHTQVENMSLIAKCGQEVIGFLLCHYYPDRQMAIISYYTVSSTEAAVQQSAKDALLSDLKKVLINHERPCDYLFFDIQNDRNVASPEKRQMWRLLPSRFGLDAQRLGLNAYEFEFKYRLPKVTVDQGMREMGGTLMCVALREELPATISKDRLLHFLRFIYMDCYGDIYEVDDPKYSRHHENMRKMLKHYEASLPADIDVRSERFGPRPSLAGTGTTRNLPQDPGAHPPSSIPSP